jgi:hypothetical protein
MIGRDVCEVAWLQLPAQSFFEAADAEEPLTLSRSGPHAVVHHVALPAPLMATVRLVSARGRVSAAVIAYVTHDVAPACSNGRNVEDAIGRVKQRRF